MLWSDVKMISDFRQAWRSLRRSPGFALVAIGTLVLGIGVTAGMFSVLEVLLLRPLPFKDPERIVRLWESNPAKGHERFDVLWGSFLDWREQSRSFAALALYRTDARLVTTGTETERMQATMASPALFPLLGVSPHLGRGFVPEEGRADGDERPDVVLSHALWQRKFGGDPGVIGQTLTVGGWASLRIVGVMPAGFDFPGGTDFWGEEVLTRSMGRGERWRSAIGRLREGVTIDQARAELKTVAQRSALDHPQTNAGWTVVIEPLTEVIVGRMRPALLALFAAVLALLLIACANVASALMARTTTRRHELAVRMALGASRWRLVRLSIAEGLLMAAVAGALGLVLADALLTVLISRAPAEVPRLDEVGINKAVVTFAVVVSLLTSLIFGVAPWLHAARVSVEEELKRGEGRSSAPARARLGGALVAAQIAISLVLLVSGGTLIDTFVRLKRLDLGLDPSRVWTSELAVPAARFTPPDQRRIGGRPQWARLASFYPEALERVRAIPSIDSVALVNVPPLARETPDFFQHGRTASSGTHAERWPATAHIITPDYFRVLRIPLRRGRAFTPDDLAAAPRLTGTGPVKPGVAIVNEAMARRYWPDRDPVGQDIALERESWVSYRTIVGVVGDTLRSPLERDAEPIVYVPLAEKPRFEMALVARARDDDPRTAAMLSTTLRRFDSALSVSSVHPLDRVIGGALAHHRFSMLMVVVFGALALLITAAGLYGVIAFIVSQRTREIGIRMALGASSTDVAYSIGQYVFAPLVGGLVAGMLGSYVVSRLSGAVIEGARGVDPVISMTAGMLILSTAGLAAWAPIRTALSLNPIAVLRNE
jgi:putative ABC transport system permease protein